MSPALPGYVAAYVGAPYADDGDPPKSFNCWQLFAYVARTERGIDLPDYNGPVWAGKTGLTAMRREAEAFAARFAPVARGEEREGDAVLLRLRGAPIHIGMVVAKGFMLHVNSGVDACIERYFDPLWRHRIVGFYRA